MIISHKYTLSYTLSQQAHVHTWHVIFGPAVGWNSHKNIHLNNPSTPHVSPSPTPSAMFTGTHRLYIYRLETQWYTVANKDCTAISVLLQKLKQRWRDNTPPAPNVCTNSSNVAIDRSALQPTTNYTSLPSYFSILITLMAWKSTDVYV